MAGTSPENDFLFNYIENYKNGTLTFNPIKKENEGKYSCIADNGAGPPLLRTITVKVNGINKYFN